MNQLDILINQRAYLQAELSLFVSPAIALIFSLIAIMAIFWVFHKYWHRFCYTGTGYLIELATIVSISIIILIYSDNRIEYRNLLQELSLVEEEMVTDYDYDL